MFTGLIQALGTIQHIEKTTAGKKFTIFCPELRPEIKVDDSVATNGVCLTATKMLDQAFQVDAVHLTLEKTTAGLWSEGEKVNLELAMRLSDRLGGHLVQGHVNGVGEIQEIRERGDNKEIKISIPKELSRCRNY